MNWLIRRKLTPNWLYQDLKMASESKVLPLLYGYLKHSTPLTMEMKPWLVKVVWNAILNLEHRQQIQEITWTLWIKVQLTIVQIERVEMCPCSRVQFKGIFFTYESFHFAFWLLIISISFFESFVNMCWQCTLPILWIIKICKRQIVLKKFHFNISQGGL